ncbi:hypothetical protein [Floridanema aerugineum]|uniref:ParB/Sulfiredoxin domain-containing protein n=1 Tax=Floridaenema aerugineum BLCC-F46 TaxID=3153654 RepID=A0ABV4XC33_9CYAN
MVVTASEQATGANLSECHFGIDPEFQALIPPPTPEELELLAANLQQFGCLQPLVVWKGYNILLDGHNRYRLCTQLQIPYSTIEIELLDRSAAIAWIADNQLGRRNITPEIASYLRGKRYCLLKGNPLDNLKQNSPKGQSVTSVDVAEQLAQQYKVSSRTIKRDARFCEAIDTLTIALGEEIKQDILGREARIAKKEALTLCRIVKNEGKKAASYRWEQLRNPGDIVQRIKDKQRVPNPRRVGEVCQIMAKGNPDLKQVSGCWCIIMEVKNYSCIIRTWRMDFDAVKPEHLEPIDGASEADAAVICQRIRQLANKVYQDFDPTHAAALEAFARLSNPASLTSKQKRLLAFLETEYGIE